MKGVRRGSLPPFVGPLAWLLVQLVEQYIRERLGLPPRG